MKNDIMPLPKLFLIYRLLALTDPGIKGLSIISGLPSNKLSKSLSVIGYCADRLNLQDYVKVEKAMLGILKLSELPKKDVPKTISTPFMEINILVRFYSQKKCRCFIVTVKNRYSLKTVKDKPWEVISRKRMS